MDSRSDLELWRLARADPDAFGVLFERRGRAVYAFCARRTADLALAEDLTSIVFLEAWRHREHTEITSESLLPWLLGIAPQRGAQRAPLATPLPGSEGVATSTETTASGNQSGPADVATGAKPHRCPSGAAPCNHVVHVLHGSAPPPHTRKQVDPHHYFNFPQAIGN